MHVVDGFDQRTGEAWSHSQRVVAVSTNGRGVGEWKRRVPPPHSFFVILQSCRQNDTSWKGIHRHVWDQSVSKFECVVGNNPFMVGSKAFDADGSKVEELVDGQTHLGEEWCVLARLECNSHLTERPGVVVGARSCWNHRHGRRRRSRRRRGWCHRSNTIDVQIEHRDVRREVEQRVCVGGSHRTEKGRPARHLCVAAMWVNNFRGHVAAVVVEADRNIADRHILVCCNC